MQAYYKGVKALASLGVNPDLLTRAIRILQEAINLMESGYTVESRAVGCKGLPIHPFDPAAQKWRLDGALEAATARVYQENGTVHVGDTIDLTVASTHPWCGANMIKIVSAKTKADAIWMTKAISDALARDQLRILAREHQATH